MMISRTIAWLNRRLEGRRPDDNATVARKLRTRCNAEIAARLIRRAEIHEEKGGYAARCSPLDREAAARITSLERLLADSGVFDRDVGRMLEILREPPSTQTQQGNTTT